ncbi:MAG: hypothetical protein AAB631_02165 [Patescibacteria group bacterium]
MRFSFKITIIAVGIIFVALLGYFVWKALSEPIVPPSESSSTSSLPFAPTAPPIKEYPAEMKGAGGTVLRRISDVPIFDYWVLKNGEDVFYFKPDGKIASAKSGPDLEVSTETISTLNRVIPNTDGTRVLVAFGSPLTPSWGVFDAQDKVWRPLPAEVKEAAWGTKTNEIVGIVQAGGLPSLATFDYTRTPVQYVTVIKDFRLTDVHFIPQSPGTLLIAEKPSFLQNGRLWRLNLKTQELSLLVQGERGLTVGWDDTFKTLFMFFSPNQFSILDERMGLQTPVIFTTFPSKCAAYASSSVYCFVPRELSTKENPATIPDDYLMRKFYTVDDLYSASEDTGTEKIFTSLSETFPAIDASHVTARAGKLYFINRYDGFLYELSLASQ